MIKDRERMMNRYIELFRATRQELAVALANQAPILARYQRPFLPPPPAPRYITAPQQQVVAATAAAVPYGWGQPQYTYAVGGMGMGSGGVAQVPAVPYVMPAPLQYEVVAATPAATAVAAAGAPTEQIPGQQCFNEGRVLMMNGLPYSASVQDIVGFFAGYNLLPSQSRIILESDGRSSGKAFATFDTQDEARRALQGKNRHSIGRRYIDLTFA
jgi:hypothetical protein